MNVTTAPADGLRPSTESDSPSRDEPGESTSRSSESSDSQDPDNPPDAPQDAEKRSANAPPADTTRRRTSGDPLIEVNDDRSAGRAVSTRWIETHLRAAAGELEHPIARLSVRLLDDAQMAELHGRTSGDPTTTDVLTFDSTEPQRPIEADIAVCVDVADRESGQRGHDIERELLLYALHGVLHCAGHDDHEQSRWKLMHDAEDRILSAIGVGPTFNPADPSQREHDTP